MNKLFKINLKVLFLFISLANFAFGNEPKEEIKLRLENIPSCEKHSLENFFKHLIFNEQFGYVIFGSKPMIFADLDACSLSFNSHSSTVSRLFIRHFIWNNYNIWEKYQNFFPMKSYIFRVFQNPNNSSNYLIIFINKNNFLKTVGNNISLFKNFLGESITPENLLYQFETKENIFEEVLKSHDGLLGIILGYGTHNSLMFQKRKEFYHSLRKNYTSPYSWKILQDDYKPKLTFFNTYGKERLVIDLPNFVEDSENLESRQLRQEYLETQKKISSLYSDGRFLEITLEALIR